MLGRLGIRQKLTLLLLFPLLAVLFALAPYTIERIGDARSAANTATTARAAREVGGLIQLLQHERLLALGYLAAPSLDRSALVAQIQDAADAAARLAGATNTRAVMARAADELAALSSVRERVIARSVDAATTYEAYRAATVALLDALRLANPAGVDIAGLRQLTALDALMRSNEEASRAGAGLVAVAGGLPFDRGVIQDAEASEHRYVERFVLLVSADQADLVAVVEGGQTGTRFDAMIDALDDPGSAVPVSDALTSALSYTGLRRLAQDRVAREIARGAESRADSANANATGVGVTAVLLVAGVLLLGVTVSRSISRPLRRLTRAAGVVAELSRTELVRVADSDTLDPAPPRIAAVDVESADEVGELAAALNRVQATAALLLERQVTTRRNVGIMFANIARRTQNLVGRQLALIDDLERNERNPELLQRLFRLDHVATRLRRSAESLLVVSGTIDQFSSGAPSPLVEIIGSALDEIEGGSTVNVGEVADVAVSAGLVTDLRLLLAELLENATNFSPPGSPVQVSARIGEECRIEIVDHGVGLSPQRLAEENQRLVERERLDVAPTSVLGLFVVGRLARRHGLSVRLEPTTGRGITAVIRIPSRLLSTAPPVGQAARKARPARAILAIEAMAPTTAEPFAWFGLAGAATPASSAASIGLSSGARSLPSSVPLQARASVAQVSQPSTPPLRRPEGAPPEPTASGLARRVPGSHMAAGIRGIESEDEAPTRRVVRDPEAERDALNDYASGLLRGPNEAVQPSRPGAGER